MLSLWAKWVECGEGEQEGREREAVLEGGVGASHAQQLSPQASSSPALPLVVL